MKIRLKVKTLYILKVVIGVDYNKVGNTVL